MITLLVMMANPALACPEAVAEATAELENRRVAHREARDLARETDWDRLMALDDRDEVLARQAAAFDELRLTRTALRDARRHLRDAEDNAGMACDPAPTSTTTG